MPPRGVSREEKRKRLQQSVKEILDELVSDHLVCFDKILLVFPQRRGCYSKLAKLEAEEETLDVKLTAAREGVASARAQREDTAERRALLAQLEAAQAESAKLQEQVKAAGDGDPAAYARKRAAVDVAKTAAVRWTGELCNSDSKLTADNTVAIMGYCKSMGTDEAELRQFLEIGRLP
ncbi:hypothetical protein A1Q1_04579 [Trichosporon asahii var. asahii CBS 2479]|uniref:Uncharacterized protein n=1 Tax=Trichosporon asahii var. asahii (strain ATCC 90039 / CBS 2479 / JCM 2466 / KCTC 7840 / NBRC 103889/ NCYC 2677 / UAMH 7654) TaxID=1186058 RepID=J5RFI0_TRIAS|nr:hypothetical protein A1Q1_04579 [Trichosporon asahii var. asahii CBS 2479]EJT52368.1 hypothetical protein A1Q1_04579 [Trichosporon asahii var. asahii CBS 2479]